MQLYMLEESQTSPAFWLSFTVSWTTRAMGCCEGKLPNPDDFLAAHHPRPVGPFLTCDLALFGVTKTEKKQL